METERKIGLLDNVKDVNGRIGQVFGLTHPSHEDPICMVIGDDFLSEVPMSELEIVKEVKETALVKYQENQDCFFKYC